MEAKVIIVTEVKSNKSENNVWMVAITGEEQGQAYCKSPYKAMRFAFLLKKQTGLSIEDASLKALSEKIALAKAAVNEEESKAEEKPLYTRKSEADSEAYAEVAEQNGLIAFL